MPVRKTLVIDADRVRGELKNFPVLVQLSGLGLAQVAPDASRLHFEDPDGNWLPSEIDHYEPDAGELRAWVCLPLLSPTTDTRFHLIAGEVVQHESRRVWDEHFQVVAHGPGPRLPCVTTGEDRKAITVEAWIDCRRAQAESIQPLVSRWCVQEAWGTFEAYDAGSTEGMDTTGFFGAVFDGRYIYFSPQYDSETRHGKVLRFDTHGEFKAPASWSAYDAGQTDGLSTRGYYGAIFDGRYVIFPPRRDPDGFHSRALRYDTRGGFHDPQSWSAYDVGAPNSSQSGAYDGRYVYFCPGQAAVPRTRVDQGTADTSPPVTGMGDDMLLISSGNFIRYDTQGPFKDRSSWTAFDAPDIDGLDTRDYDGAVFDGRYVHFAPLSYGVPLRYDTRGDFHDRASWQAFDAARWGLRRCVGAVFDGRYVYYVPYGDTTVAIRYDTRDDFHDDRSWQRFDYTKTEGLHVTGYDGGFFDGRFIYYIPYWDEGKVLHGVVLRYDTTRPFTQPSSWSCIDADLTDGLRTGGFNGGASDGRYLYFAPWIGDAVFTGRIGGCGRVLRYDTTGDQASFSLRWSDLGHNGGLCAALPGPRFLINTDRGPISVAANRTPQTGKHHLAGVYDGQVIQLYLDGELVNEQEAVGRRIADSDEDHLTVGCLGEGCAVFEGSIDEVRLSSVARSAAWIATTCANLRDPAAFCRMA